MYISLKENRFFFINLLTAYTSSKIKKSKYLLKTVKSRQWDQHNMQKPGSTSFKNHPVSEGNCPYYSKTRKKVIWDVFSDGAAENSSEVGDPIVFDIEPPRLCPTELRRSSSYTRYLYMCLKQAQVFVFVFKIYKNLDFAICHLSAKPEYSIKNIQFGLALRETAVGLNFMS